MKTIKQLVYTLAMLVFAVVAISSCDKDVVEPLEQFQTSKSSKQEAMRAFGISDLEGWNIVIDHGASYGYKLYESGGNYLQKTNL